MIGQTISHYRIVEQLGEGGMGVVYKAEDTKLKRMVALKFLPAELTRDRDAKARFVREARAASALDHPNICTIHEIDETDDGRVFICMACYEGETLREAISKRPLELGRAIDITMRVAEGLAQAHEQGIFHRDVKPANIFVTKDGQVKVVDFGLASGARIIVPQHHDPLMVGAEPTDLSKLRSLFEGHDVEFQEFVPGRWYSYP